MNTLITKTHFYVRPMEADGTARQEFVRLQPGAVLRQQGQRWCEGMSYHPVGEKQLMYAILVRKGLDDLDRDWSGQRAFVSPERFTGALVEDYFPQSDNPAWEITHSSRAKVR